jgi:signal transduction histidine kinase/Na+/proline symporter
MIGFASLAAAGLIWVGALFAVAVWAERRGVPDGPLGGSIYALSLAAYCTTWTFYGTVSQAAQYGWWLPPTFLGTILMFLLADRFWRRLVARARAQNSTSLADFLAACFGKSTALAATVTFVAVLGLVPYIALQLKAVAMSYTLLLHGHVEPAAGGWQDSALWVALLFAAFAMLFGTRRANAAEHNVGLVAAMAFESLLKLLALAWVGAYAAWAWWRLPPAPPELPSTLPMLPAELDIYAVLVGLGALAMFTLPHQFHLGVVECVDRRRIDVARWLFPLYLLLIALPITPIAIYGTRVLAPTGVDSDLYVLAIPLSHGEEWLALTVFLGGLSAATGMVIMATLSLGIMVGNHWLMPLWLRTHGVGDGRSDDLRGLLLTQRRWVIALTLLAAYGFGRLFGEHALLGDIGALSFAALAQLAPGVLLGVYARRPLPPRVVLAGLWVGLCGWSLLVLAPAVLRTAAHSGFATWWFDWPFSLAVSVSLLANVAVLLALAPRSTATVPATAELEPELLQRLAARFLPPEEVRRLFAERSSTALAEQVEHALTAVVGAASARLLLDSARGAASLDEVARAVDERSAALRFNQRVLEAALENMSQGISVVDAELRLVAWNRRYAELFAYPPELLAVGRPIADLVRYNATRGLLGQGDVEAEIDKRLAYMRSGSRHVFERTLPDGTVLEIRGNPMPGGGFVTTFTDVTAFRRTEVELTQAKATLEQRVAARTAELEQAKLAAERADQAKSRFLAAVSHDLVQPIHAAHLFTLAAAQRAESEREQLALRQIGEALGSAEQLLAALLDISRLDAGRMPVQRTPLELGALLGGLAREFAVLAAEKGLALHYVPTRVWVDSDPQLLRRIVQNFLSNAVRYAERGRVTLGCRRRGAKVRVEVWDTGPGIPAHEQRAIFDEFHRLQPGTNVQGLGLGLTIAERIGHLLGHPLHLRSWVGRGSVFAVELPRVPAPSLPPAAVAADPETISAIRGTVLVLDNDATVLEATAALLESWHCRVLAAASAEEAERRLRSTTVDLILLDQHLDGDRTGLEVLAGWGFDIPAVLVTADRSVELRRSAEAQGVDVLYKPLKPLQLKSLLARRLRN